jgi:tRNA A-37 threonylcarbamoyl transferase component Bud32
MIRRERSAAGPLLAPSALRIDAACNRFEADWAQGGRPRIEDYLDQVDGQERRALLRELLLLEIELARHAGETPTPAAYRARFAGETGLIDEAFSQGSTVRHAPCVSSEVAEPATPGGSGWSIGRYVVLARLDEGGQAVVYRVMHPALGREYVLKWSRRAAVLGREESDRLVAEGRLLAALDHPNLVRVVDLDVCDGRPFLVMESVPGLSLQQHAAQHPLTPRRAAALVAELARGAGYLHRRGIVHQDIKPRNVLIDEDGRPRLIDLGLARLQHAWSDAPNGPSGGTLAYMAPEQAEGRADRVKPWTDVFGLGAVLYELLTGRPPYQADNAADLETQAREARVIPPRRLNRRVPRALERVCLKALARVPEDRYPSADHLDRALRRCLRRRTVVAVGLAAAGAVALASWAWIGNPPTLAAAEVVALNIEHVSADTYLGVLGAPSHTAPIVFDDDVRVLAKLSAPAFCYLLALNPDGRVQLRDPDEPTVRPVRAVEVVDPSDPRTYFTLNDGVGLQGFVLIASRTPLPPYADWPPRGALERLWKQTGSRIEAAGAWRFDGRTFRPLGRAERGSERTLPVPPQFEAVCQFLRDRAGADGVHAVAFPVHPRPEGGPTR